MKTVNIAVVASILFISISHLLLVLSADFSSGDRKKHRKYFGKTQGKRERTVKALNLLVNPTQAYLSKLRP